MVTQFIAKKNINMPRVFQENKKLIIHYKFVLQVDQFDTVALIYPLKISVKPDRLTYTFDAA